MLFFSCLILLAHKLKGRWSQIFLGAATCTGATEAISAVLLCDVATIPEVHQGMLSTKVFEGHLTSKENKKKDTLLKIGHPKTIVFHTVYFGCEILPGFFSIL